MYLVLPRPHVPISEKGSANKSRGGTGKGDSSINGKKHTQSKRHRVCVTPVDFRLEHSTIDTIYKNLANDSGVAKERRSLAVQWNILTVSKRA